MRALVAVEVGQAGKPLAAGLKGTDVGAVPGVGPHMSEQVEIQ